MPMAPEPPTIRTGATPMLRYPAIIAPTVKETAAAMLSVRVVLLVSMFVPPKSTTVDLHLDRQSSHVNAC
jgi:hypothetical protein